MMPEVQLTGSDVLLRKSTNDRRSVERGDDIAIRYVVPSVDETFAIRVDVRVVVEKVVRGQNTTAVLDHDQRRVSDSSGCIVVA